MQKPETEAVAADNVIKTCNMLKFFRFILQREETLIFPYNIARFLLIFIHRCYISLLYY